LARDAFLKLYEFPKPTIAVVHGPALAGGAGLASCCDFVIAAREATFGYPEVRIGFVPALVMVFLTHQVGERHARDLCLSGRTVDATEAHRMGLVSKVVSAGELDAAVAELAVQLRRNSPQAMATVKSEFGGIHGMTLQAALDRAVTMNALARGTEDCREGIAAFLEKRKPRWIG
jgi:methylglutaconyl-CoA hydratase